MDLADAGVVVDLEDLLPGGAAVGRPVEAAVVARAPQGALGRHVDHVGVARIDGDHAHVLGVLQAHHLEVPAAVDGLVDPVAVGDAALAVVLAGAHPQHLRIAGIESQTTDGVGPLPVEDGRVGDAPVGRLPDAARAHGHVVLGGIVRVDGEVAHAARREGRAQQAEPEGGEGAGVEAVVFFLFVLGQRGRGHEGQQQEQGQRAFHRVHLSGEPPLRALRRRALRYLGCNQT